MPQISLYVDKETLEMIQAAADAAKTSISNWVVTQLREKLDSTYPEGYQELFGSVKDGDLKEP